MTTKNKHWKWADDAPGRKIQSEYMTKRLMEGKTGRPFPMKHGMGGTKTYNSWKKMMSRCYNENDQDYCYWGARGIVVCDRWHDPRNFLDDMGEKPEKASLERIDVNGNYEKSNCIWLPHRFQAKNRRPWKHSPEGLDRIRAARIAAAKQ
jgi:hypothetical protein